jgi:triphosphoribosyl-dephospho-CoA synthetase
MITPPYPRVRRAAMPTYQMVYGDPEQVVRETFDDVEVQREDGWVVLFRGKEAILRVKEEHVQSLEVVEDK